MRMITKEQLEALRSRFPAGTRVELLQMDDPLSRILDNGSYQYS